MPTLGVCRIAVGLCGDVKQSKSNLRVLDTAKSVPNARIKLKGLTNISVTALVGV